MHISVTALFVIFVNIMLTKKLCIFFIYQNVFIIFLIFNFIYCLNYYNIKLEKILLLTILFQLYRPSDDNYEHFWVDFNARSERIIIFCLPDQDEVCLIYYTTDPNPYEHH